MKVQSLSIHVPTKGCVNNCKFCVSRMHECPYKDRIGEAIRDTNHTKEETLDTYDDYENRLWYAKENGVSTVILTGIGEPIQNIHFLEWFGSFNKRGTNFRWIEIQTSGNRLLDTIKMNSVKHEISVLRFLRYIGVSTISLSVSDIFDSENNTRINNIPSKHQFDLDELCKKIKEENFNLRLSLNMVDSYNNKTPKEIFNRLKELGVDQVTFRELYTSENEDTKQDKWIKEHAAGEITLSLIETYISSKGKFQGVLPFGTSKYSVEGISTVVDNNCMDNATKRVEPDSYKYLILRPNCKLYSNWDDEGSLIF